MEASEHFQPPAELKLVLSQPEDGSETQKSNRQPDCLKLYQEDNIPIYYFFEDGTEASATTLTSEQCKADGAGVDFIYHLRFYGWEYGQADVHCEGESVAVEWAGLADGLDDMAALQARKLMLESDVFLLAALKVDFPEGTVEDAAGNPL